MWHRRAVEQRSGFTETAGGEQSGRTPRLTGGGRDVQRGSAEVICLKERNFAMLKTDLIFRNPLRLLGHESEDIVAEGEFGAVLAGAGVGKTAFVVQLALDSALRNRHVLHVSMNEPITKVSVWYKEVFSLLAQQYKIDQMNALWDSMLPYRFIMTFKVEGFSVPKLQERLTDLMAQQIFDPQMIIIDGMPFSESVRASLSDLKAFIRNNSMSAWFSVRTHRHEPAGPEGLPFCLSPVADMFDVIIRLQPEGEDVHIDVLKGKRPSGQAGLLRLDPSTMLIKTSY